MFLASASLRKAIVCRSIGSSTDNSPPTTTMQSNFAGSVRLDVGATWIPQLAVMRCCVLARTCQSADTRPERSSSSLASLNVSVNNAKADRVNDLASMKPIFNLFAFTIERCTRYPSHNMISSSKAPELLVSSFKPAKHNRFTPGLLQPNMPAAAAPF